MLIQMLTTIKLLIPIMINVEINVRLIERKYQICKLSANCELLDISGHA